MSLLTYNKDKFYLDDKEFTIISGAMHYFRIPREYWYDRLLKLKECGFNTVETYTCWNLHEPEEGIFDFSGMLDLEAYIEIAQELVQLLGAEILVFLFLSFKPCAHCLASLVFIGNPHPGQCPGSPGSLLRLI